MEIHVCPWCESDDVGAEYDGAWQVQCGNCTALGKAEETEEAAIKAWNENVKARWKELAPNREMMRG